MTFVLWLDQFTDNQVEEFLLTLGKSQSGSDQWDLFACCLSPGSPCDVRLVSLTAKQGRN